MNHSESDSVNELIIQPQYSLTFEEKQRILLSILGKQVNDSCQASPQFARYCERLSFRKKDFQSYEEVPYVPVSLFKKFELLTVPRDSIVRVLMSSGTSSGFPSKIFLDRPTSQRQRKSLAMILKSHIGGKKRPFLVLDVPKSNAEADSLSARGAAIRGLSPFGSTICYGLTEKNGDLVPEEKTLENFFEEHKKQEVLVFGFTYIVWKNTLNYLKQKGIQFPSNPGFLLHSGGWKFLTEQRVGKEIFRQTAADIFGIRPERVLDFYGMVELVGVIFMDCEAGNKHVPNFSEVLIRDVSTLRPVDIGKSGFIQAFSVLPTSYPGQSLLTEDLGTLLGYDDCACGRKGTYFQFRSRVKSAEIRGCGDTFAMGRILS